MDICICGRKIEDRSTRCSRCAALHEIGLENGATEPEIKEAYRAHVKAWHPDRYPDDKTQQRVAERKLKKINAAYRLLTSLEPISELLPPAPPQPSRPQSPAEPMAERWQKAPSSASSHTAREDAFAYRSAPRPRPESDAYSIWEQPIPRTANEDELGGVNPLPPSTGSRGLKTSLIYALLFVAVIAGTYFLNTEQLKSPLLHRAGSASAIPTAAGVTVAGTQQAQGAPVVPEFFTLGSSKAEVIAVQGPPTAQDSSVNSSVLHYGLSTVSLQNDQVAGWMVFPLNPLKVRILPTSTPSATPGYFDIRSSKDEVIALQGTPTAVSQNTYFYGKSSVTFQDGKVSTWSLSPTDPLHVKR